MARGMATTRAGVGAILAVSEIAFAFLLDVALLREPTTPLAALGSSLVSNPNPNPNPSPNPNPNPHPNPHPDQVDYEPFEFLAGIAFAFRNSDADAAAARKRHSAQL